MSLTSKMLTVTQEQINISSTTCYDISIPSEDLNIIHSKDLLIYATAGAGGNSYYANAIACILRSNTPKRPIVGRIKYNTDLVGSDVVSISGFQTTSRVAFH